VKAKKSARNRRTFMEAAFNEYLEAIPAAKEIGEDKMRRVRDAVGLPEDEEDNQRGGRGAANRRRC